MMEQLGELHEGLADYFSARFLESPLHGEGVGRYLGLKTSYIRSLANEDKYSAASPDDAFSRSVVWSGALWSCRGKLGQAVADGIVLQAWLELREHPQSKTILRTFASNLVKHERTVARTSSGGCLADQIAKRELPR